MCRCVDVCGHIGVALILIDNQNICQSRCEIQIHVYKNFNANPAFLILNKSKLSVCNPRGWEPWIYFSFICKEQWSLRTRDSYMLGDSSLSLGQCLVVGQQTSIKCTWLILFTNMIWELYTHITRYEPALPCSISSLCVLRNISKLDRLSTL